MYIYLLSKRKWPRRTKTLLHDLVVYYFYLLDRGKRRQSRKHLLFIWYAKRNNIVVKTIYFNSCLMFDLLAVIYECFTFRVFLVCVWASVHSDPFLLHYAMFGFCHCQLNYNNIVWICPFSTAQYNLYGIENMYYHIYCLRQRLWIWNLIPTPMCKSYVCHIYFMSLLNGFIPLVKVIFLVLLSLFMCIFFKEFDN